MVAGFAQGVLSVVTDVLETLDGGGSGRSRFCAAVAELFGSERSGHAWYDVTNSSSSCCLWCAGPEGRRTVTVTRHESEQVRAVESAWWERSACRSLILDWTSSPYLAEIPLGSDDRARGMIVLGRDRPFGNEDARRMNAARRHLVAVERILVRLQAPLLEDADDASQRLTDRESQVLLLLSEGLLARSIAQRLDVSERTVHKHLGNVYRKLDAHDRLLAVRRAESLGLIPAPRQPSEVLQPA